MITRACLLLITLTNASAISCQNAAGEPVASYVVRNLPAAHEPRVVTDGQFGSDDTTYKSWAFFDLSATGTGADTSGAAFEFEPVTTDTVPSGLKALIETQAQWMQFEATGWTPAPGVNHISWNDGKGQRDRKYGRGKGAHDKGFLAWHTDGTGIYMGHSYPSWFSSQGPEARRRKKGQHAICISLPNFEEVTKVLQVLQVIKPMVKTQTFCDEALSTTDTSEVPTSANRNDGETTANFFVRQKANLCLRLKNSASRLTKYKHVQLRDTSGNSFDLYGKPTGLNFSDELERDIFAYVADKRQQLIKVSTWEKLDGLRDALKRKVIDLAFACPTGMPKYKIQKIDHSKWGYSYEGREDVYFAGSNRISTQHGRGAMLIVVGQKNLHAATKDFFRCDGGETEGRLPDIDRVTAQLKMLSSKKVPKAIHLVQSFKPQSFANTGAFQVKSTQLLPEGTYAKWEVNVFENDNLVKIAAPYEGEIISLNEGTQYRVEAVLEIFDEAPAQIGVDSDADGEKGDCLEACATNDDDCRSTCEVYDENEESVMSDTFIFKFFLERQEEEVSLKRRLENSDGGSCDSPFRQCKKGRTTSGAWRGRHSLG